MVTFLKNHPFAVEAFFDYSLVLTFAVPKEEIQHLIPDCLELDLFDNKWAFIAVAMVQTSQLRPKGFPTFLGHDFFLIGYRVFVRYRNRAGKRLRGLYILKSETNQKKMEILGNIFTHYNYTTTDVKLIRKNNKLQIESSRSKFKVEIETLSQEITIPEFSPFSDWKEARKFAGPLPFTFTYNPDSRKVLIIEGVRPAWKPDPVNVIECHFHFLQTLRLQEVRLANAFIINNIPYYWKRGKMEQWDT